jgi:hypothetical protein
MIVYSDDKVKEKLRDTFSSVEEQLKDNTLLAASNFAERFGNHIALIWSILYSQINDVTYIRYIKYLAQKRNNPRLRLMEHR